MATEQLSIKKGQVVEKDGKLFRAQKNIVGGFSLGDLPLNSPDIFTSLGSLEEAVVGHGGFLKNGRIVANEGVNMDNLNAIINRMNLDSLSAGPLPTQLVSGEGAALPTQEQTGGNVRFLQGNIPVGELDPRFFEGTTTQRTTQAAITEEPQTIEGVLKRGTDVFVVENGEERKIELPEFKELGINFDFLKEGEAVSLEEAVSGVAPSLATSNVADNVNEALPSADFKVDIPETLDSSLLQEGLTVTDAEIKDLMEELKAQAPSAPSLLDDFEAIRSEQGIPALERQLNEVNAQIRDAEAALRQGLNAIETTQVSTRIQSQEQLELRRQAQETLDFLGRRKQALVDELNTKNNVVATIMDLTQQDFQNANTVYAQEFNRNLQMIELLQGLKEQAQATALANWEILANNYESVGLTWDTLNPEQQAQIESLAVKAGMPGLSQFIGANAAVGEIKTVTTRTSPSGQSFYDILRVNPDGSLSVESIARGAVRISTGGSSNDIIVDLGENITFNVSDILKDSEVQSLKASGLDTNTIAGITLLLVQNAELDDIRQALREDGLDPKVLDDYDRIVGIERIRGREEEGDSFTISPEDINNAIQGE